MGQFVIACYRPKPGQEAALLDEIINHVPTLRVEGLVTDRLPCLMRAQDGTIIEIFEWRSAEAVEQAHQNLTVTEMWKRFSTCCDNIAIGDLEEAGQLFSPFEPLDLA